MDLPEQPTAEELAALNPELAEALFGTAEAAVLRLARVLAVRRGRLRARDRDRAGSADSRFGRAPRPSPRPLLSEADARLRDLWEIVGRFDSTDVLIDDKPMPYARELWLPLMWI